MISRRNFLMRLFFLKIFFFKRKTFSMITKDYDTLKTKTKKQSYMNKIIKSDTDMNSVVYKVFGECPKKNMSVLIKKLGGIKKIISKNDIVVIKPNAQWWAQGMTNTDSIKAFIEIILSSKDFNGEIIIAENNQYSDFNERGWTTKNPNGKYNYYDLVEYFNKKGFKNVTIYHWRCASANPEPLEGNDDGSGGKIVNGPDEGDGYVWRKDLLYKTPEGRECWMTYPIFTSKYSGITVDLKNGAWKNGKYVSDKFIKFINFSALNHHGFYCGITASIKNLMGVVDMSCGFQAPKPNGTYNVHFIGVNKIIKYHKYFMKKHLWRFHKKIIKYSYKNFHYTGGALGFFIKNIRKPDLNIITAHWVGWGSRWDKDKSSYPKTLLASHDPVALDYVAAKDILLKETPDEQIQIKRLNNPDIQDGPFYKFLRECHLQGIGNLNEDKIKRIEVKIG